VQNRKAQEFVSSFEMERWKNDKIEEKFMQAMQLINLNSEIDVSKRCNSYVELEIQKTIEKIQVRSISRWRLSFFLISSFIFTGTGS
jgi:hypothetical protein